MLARWLAFARGLLRRRAIEAEADEELAFHLEQEARVHLERGVPADEARRLAALSLGGVSQTRDAVRDVRTTWIESAWRETGHAFRMLRATPAYTIPSVLVLALGIGGTTAVFSVVDSVLLRPLPYPDSTELVRVWSRNDERQIPFLSVSSADFEDWRGRATAISRVGAYERPRVLQLRDSGEPVTAMRVTADLLPTLGIAPAIGRGFRAGDESAAVAVISHELWQRHFRGTRDALGRLLHVGEDAWVVIGVMPPRFEVPIAPADVWVPLDTGIPGNARFAHTLRVVARVPGASAVTTARRDLEAVAAALAVERPDTNRGWSVTVLPLFDVVVSPEFRQALGIVAGAVLFVLVMASTSAVSLSLTRAFGRQRELAVRLALGASRGSLVRLLSIESLVLTVVAGLAGLLLASWGVRLLQTVGAASVPRLDELSMSGRVFAFAAVTTLLSALAAGVAPAWRSTRSLHDKLRSRGDVSQSTSARALHALVVVEVTSAVLLAVGGALLVQTVLNLQHRDLGFNPANLVTIDAIWPSSGQRQDFVPRTEHALSRLMALPGVARVAAVNAPPFSGGNSGNTFQIEGESPAGASLPDADYRVVSPGYFETLGLPVREGRAFTPADGETQAAVVISDTAARRFWPAGDAIGRRLKMGSSDWLTIVGIVGDARYLALDDPTEAVRPMLYLPHRQMPSTTMTLVVRSTAAPEALIPSVRHTVITEAGLGITRVVTMQGLLRDASMSQRFTMKMVTAFAMTAVTLVVVGLYGLLVFVIAQRTREIAVRVALGAKHWDIVRDVAGRTALLVCAGVAAGLALSFGLGDAVRSVLFGVSAHDPLTYGFVALGFMLVAMAASAVPTFRALRIDPVRVIRGED